MYGAYFVPKMQLQFSVLPSASGRQFHGQHMHSVFDCFTWIKMLHKALSSFDKINLPTCLRRERSYRFGAESIINFHTKV